LDKVELVSSVTIEHCGQLRAMAPIDDCSDKFIDHFDRLLAKVVLVACVQVDRGQTEARLDKRV
jgi:hypothetical protein